MPQVAPPGSSLALLPEAAAYLLISISSHRLPPSLPLPGLRLAQALGGRREVVGQGVLTNTSALVFISACPPTLLSKRRKQPTFPQRSSHGRGPRPVPSGFPFRLTELSLSSLGFPSTSCISWVCLISVQTCSPLSRFNKINETQL